LEQDYGLPRRFGLRTFYRF